MTREFHSSISAAWPDDSSSLRCRDLAPTRERYLKYTRPLTKANAIAKTKRTINQVKSLADADVPEMGAVELKTIDELDDVDNNNNVEVVFVVFVDPDDDVD